MSQRFTPWLVSALLYSVFVIWYTDLGGPLTDKEIDGIIADTEALRIRAVPGGYEVDTRRARGRAPSP